MLTLFEATTYCKTGLKDPSRKGPQAQCHWLKILLISTQRNGSTDLY